MAFYDLPGKTILMHNRRGIRIELNLDREGLLELWISPTSGASRSCRERNFSNRDDHTRLFDRIGLPGLPAEQFIACEWDPFHSVVRFRQQTLHLLNMCDQPAVVLWCERPQTVDIKSDKADTPLERSAHAFVVSHPDRGKRFTYAAMVGVGGGVVHQQVLDAGRSTYCRSLLAAGQPLVLAGGSGSPGVRSLARRLALARPARLLADNERTIAAQLRCAGITLRSDPALQSLVDTSRRALHSMQDTSGAIRAALNRIYYLIWVRDGAIIECCNGYTGRRDALRNWVAFLLANPTIVAGEKPAGRMFGQLVNPITKWQEDGAFYAVWSVFTAWTQSGVDAAPPVAAQRVLCDAVDWLERYCFDGRRGLFGRYYACETPLPGSHDDGFDGAVGKATGSSHMRWQGSPARRSYDLYVNLYMYAAYQMLAAMAPEEQRHRALRGKALRLGRALQGFAPRRRLLPDYGDVLTDRGVRRAAAYGLDPTDYLWGLTIPPFSPWPERAAAMRQALLTSALAGRNEPYFLAGYYAICTSVDPLLFGESRLYRAIRRVARKSYPPGAYLPMPNAMKEMYEVPDGHRSHDVRPQAFSIGPFLASLYGLGLRRLPFGLAVRPGTPLRRISGYQYGRGTITLEFSGAGRWCDVRVDGRPQAGSLQLPDSLLRTAATRVRVAATSRRPAGPLLIASTVRLRSVAASRSGTSYRCRGYGCNVLEFVNVRPGAVRVTRRGVAVRSVTRTVGAVTYVMFDGRGAFEVTA